MKRNVLAILAALLLAQNLPATEPGWYVLSREEGCLPLDQAYELFPFLKGGRNPSELFPRFHAAFPDATMVPFLDYVAAGQVRGEITPDEAALAAHKVVTRSNAFVLSSAREGAKIYLLDAAVCDELRGPRRKP